MSGVDESVKKMKYSYQSIIDAAVRCVSNGELEYEDLINVSTLIGELAGCCDNDVYEDLEDSYENHKTYNIWNSYKDMKLCLIIRDRGKSHVIIPTALMERISVEFYNQKNGHINWLKFFDFVKWMGENDTIVQSDDDSKFNMQSDITMKKCFKVCGIDKIMESIPCDLYGD